MKKNTVIRSTAIMLSLCVKMAYSEELFRIAPLYPLQPSSVPEFYRDFEINDNGQVVGVTISRGQEQGATWLNGAVNNLGVYLQSNENGLFSTGVAINNSGEVVGQADNDEDNQFAAVYEPSGWFRILYPEGCNISWARSISSSGQVAGFATVDPYEEPYGIGFLAVPPYNNGPATTLFPLSGDEFSDAVGISDDGIIVGVSMRTNGNTLYTRAVYWNTNGGGPFPLTTSEDSWAQSEKNGYVVGFEGNNAVVFVNSTFIITTGIANAINVNNFVVGNSVTSNIASDSRAWLCSLNA